VSVCIEAVNGCQLWEKHPFGDNKDRIYCRLSALNEAQVERRQGCTAGPVWRTANAFHDHSCKRILMSFLLERKESKKMTCNVEVRVTHTSKGMRYNCIRSSGNFNYLPPADWRWSIFTLCRCCKKFRGRGRELCINYYAFSVINVQIIFKRLTIKIVNSSRCLRRPPTW